MKKLISVLAIVLCVFGLTACSSSEQELDLTAREQDVLSQYAHAMWSDVITAHENSEFRAMTDQIRVYQQGLLSLETALPDLGTVDPKNGDPDVIVKTGDKEYEVRFDIHGEKHDATVVTSFEKQASVIDGIAFEPKSIATNVDFTFGELMQQAALNTVLGMGTTFVVLILLAIIIALFGKVMSGASKTKKAAPAAAPAKAAPAAAPAPAPVEETVDDGELIAVIAAAIAASEGRTSTDGFVVRSIRKAARTGWRN